jgi:hypothetical protein
MARRERLLRTLLGLPQGLIERAEATAQPPRRGAAKFSHANVRRVPQVSILRPGKSQTSTRVPSRRSIRP